MRAAAALAALMVPAVPALAQPEGHIGGPAAEIIRANGCEMAEDALWEAMQAQGFDLGDLQAQVTALARSGHFHADRPLGSLRLTNWGECD